jgi:hypothetical protein
VLLLLAAAAVVAAVLLARPQSTTDGQAQRYVCPMHPEISAPTPGQCPICRMALEPARLRPAPPSVAPEQSTTAVRSAPSVPLASGPRGDGQGEGPPVPADTFTVLALPQDRLFADIMGVRSRPVTRQILAAAWVDSAGIVMANLYRDEAALLDPADEAVFLAGSGSAVETRVRLTPAAPTEWDGTTLLVRLQAVKTTPPVGTIGWVKFAPKARKLLAVPYSAVLQGATGPYVLVASVDRHTFTRRPVQLGRVVYGYAPVLSGLTSNERVAVMETFFIDAEGRLGSEIRRAAGEAPP